MITTSGGGALICPDAETKSRIMFYATQARESYPYYQHEKIGYNYRLSNICAGIGRGQMTVLEDHLAHHRHVCTLYKELFASVEGISVHENPSPRYDSNYWLNTISIDPSLHVKGEEDAYKTIVTGAVGGAAGVIHAASSAVTDCQPNDNVEALRVFMDKAQIKSIAADAMGIDETSISWDSISLSNGPEGMFMMMNGHPGMPGHRGMMPEAVKEVIRFITSN